MAFVATAIEDTVHSRVESMGHVGDVRTEMLAPADDVDPRCLVSSRRRRSPAGTAIFGTTAQRSLPNADCPPLTKLTDE